MTLPFDFYIPSLKILIEFDGIQHFKPISIWGGEKALISQTERDEIKNNFAIQNNFKLIRISYVDLNKIDKILETIIKIA